MWLAIHMANIPYRAAPSNLNYYLHFTGAHRQIDTNFDIVLMHYHDSSLNVLGQIEPKAELNEIERLAVENANKQIGQGFESATFWNLRYSQFSERGSGVGSRGDNLLYKRQLLVREGAEQAGSVLDVGCGDLEVVKALDLQNYLGIDTSKVALEIARDARPEWEFRNFDFRENLTEIPAKQLVLCFEVLIHQSSEALYCILIEFLASHTERTLLVSGYETDSDQRRQNAMLFFYKPLEESLRRTGKFASIKKIGSHSDVAVYRCNV
jgi:SAM-dependent methyltransferase